MWSARCSLATSLPVRLYVQLASCNVQRATCNANGSCQVFLFVFHRPGRAAAIYLPRSFGLRLLLLSLCLCSGQVGWRLLPSGQTQSTSPALNPFWPVLQFMCFLLYYHLNDCNDCDDCGFSSIDDAGPDLGLAINSSSLGWSGQRVLHKLWSCRFLWQTIKKDITFMVMLPWTSCSCVFNLKCKYKLPRRRHPLLTSRLYRHTHIYIQGERTIPGRSRLRALLISALKGPFRSKHSGGTINA